MEKGFRLKRIELKNFKGIRSRVIETGKITDIFGDNETGKTTIFDAYLWLFANKDSTNRTQFAIKPLDENSEPISGLETSVIADIETAELERRFEKSYSEIWTKKRGTGERKFTGHETKYKIDDVPKAANEFNKEVEEYVGPELFRMLTDVHYFANTLDWQSRRDKIIELVGDVSDDDIAAANPGLIPIIKMLTSKKKINDLQESLKSRKRKLNDAIKTIPVRIDEANLSIKDIDVSQLAERLKKKKAELKKVDNSIADLSKTDPETADKTEKIKELNRKITKIEAEKDVVKQTDIKKLRDEKNIHVNNSEDFKDKLDRKVKELNSFTNQLTTLKKEIASLEENLTAKTSEKFVFNEEDVKAKVDKHNEFLSKKESLEKKKEELVKAWCAKDEEEFVLNDDFICPTCKRKLEADAIETKTEELKNNFNLNKENRLAEIEEEGQKINTELEEVNKEIATLKDEIDNAEQKQKEAFNLARATSITEINTQLDIKNVEKGSLKEKIEENIKFQKEYELSKKVQDELATDKQNEINNYVIDYGDEYQKLKDEVSEIMSSMEEPADNSEQKKTLEDEKSLIEAEIEKINQELNQEEVNKKQLARIKELEAEERELAQQIVNIEKDEDLCGEYIKTKVGLMDKRINEKFSFVNFKMFEKQINEGIKETCEVLINGIPFKDANHASKVNAGIDIINTLSEHYNIALPLFIDYSESVTKFLETDLQIVRLFVSNKDKKLRIENSEQLDKSQIFKQKAA